MSHIRLTKTGNVITIPLISSNFTAYSGASVSYNSDGTMNLRGFVKHKDLYEQKFYKKGFYFLRLDFYTTANNDDVGLNIGGNMVGGNIYNWKGGRIITPTRNVNNFIIIDVLTDKVYANNNTSQFYTGTQTLSSSSIYFGINHATYQIKVLKLRISNNIELLRKF